MPDNDEVEANASAMVEEWPDASHCWGAGFGAGTSSRVHVHEVHASSAAEWPAHLPRHDDKLPTHPPTSGSGAGGGEGAKGKKDK